MVLKHSKDDRQREHVIYAIIYTLVRGQASKRIILDFAALSSSYLQKLVHIKYTPFLVLKKPK